MTNELTAVNETENNHEYPLFSRGIHQHFNRHSDQPLFRTDVENLFDIFLEALPEEHRQHYNCNCCRSFINRYGNLVTIDEAGITESVMWDLGSTPKFFYAAVANMRKIVLKAKVKAVFIPDSTTLGSPHTNGWDHMSVSVPSAKVHRSGIKTAGQVMADKKEDYRMLVGAMLEYPIEVIAQVVNLCESETMYRGGRILGVAKFAKDLQEKRNNAVSSKAKDNLTWLAVATAPNGFTHIKSSMIGTVLDDIKDGLSLDAVTRRFKDKMNPAVYMRSQSAPSQGNIDQAEKIVADLGLEEALRRRYSRLDEITERVWTNPNVPVKAIEDEGVTAHRVFGNITPKQKETTATLNMEMPTTTMTWDKFKRTILPSAENLEVRIDNTNHFMALVTAVDPEAPNILQWDNTFSWYYHSGIDGEIKRRVEAAGGKYEDNEIRVSLIWENTTDLDLNCVSPLGEKIFFGSKRGRCGGWLDIDQNVHGETWTPVENIRWSRGKAPEGRYVFKVHNYKKRHGDNPYRVELEVGGKVYTHSGNLKTSKGEDTVFEFDYIKGQEPRMYTSNGFAVTASEAWGVNVGEFVKVEAIVNSPNTWGDKPLNHIGEHVFFLLDGVKDESEGKGRGFFTETLKNELREVRKTLEAYTANTPIEDADQASACGVGFSKDNNNWDIVIKAHVNGSNRLIKIDRWD